MIEKYLFSLEVDPYEPNRQLSIINSNGGKPRYHFPTNGGKGVLVAMISFEDVNKLQNQYDWIAGVYRGYSARLNEFET